MSCEPPRGGDDDEEEVETVVEPVEVLDARVLVIVVEEVTVVDALVLLIVVMEVVVGGLVGLSVVFSVVKSGALSTDTLAGDGFSLVAFKDRKPSRWWHPDLKSARATYKLQLNAHLRRATHVTVRGMISLQSRVNVQTTHRRGDLYRVVNLRAKRVT